VGIVDDEPLVRAGVRGVLERAEEIVVVGEAHNGKAGIELAMRHRPQVLLVDTTMPGTDGLVMLRELRRHVPMTQVVMLATPATSELLVPALRAGAAGFLLKNREPGELVNAVRAVAAGDAVLCPTITRSFVDQVIGRGVERQDQARRQVRVLTEREREVLGHVAKGMGNAKIARAMSLSEGSIKAYVTRLLTKLRCENRVQAALIAYDAALIH
jgi:DNA-binding NarL/FixJ family response regulator